MTRHGGPDGFQVPAPGSRAEGDSSGFHPWMALQVRCDGCGVAIHKVETLPEGLKVRCASGQSRWATAAEREAVYDAAAVLLGVASVDRRREAHAPPRLRALGVL